MGKPSKEKNVKVPMRGRGRGRGGSSISRGRNNGRIRTIRAGEDERPPESLVLAEESDESGKETQVSNQLCLIVQRILVYRIRIQIWVSIRS